MIISITFSGNVLGCPLRESRITCIVNVLAPLTTYPACIFWIAARPTAIGSTPGCM